MTSRKVVVSAVALFVSVTACTGGSGPSSLPFPASRDTPPNLRDILSGREDPGTPRENPGDDRQAPIGTRGPGDGACPACDAIYACQLGQDATGSFELTLVTQDGVCALAKDNADFKCDGRIVSNAGGQTIYWHPYGPGGFAASTLAGDLTCVPETNAGAGGGSSNGNDPPSTPGSSSSGSGSSNAGSGSTGSSGGPTKPGTGH